MSLPKVPNYGGDLPTDSRKAPESRPYVALL